MMAVANASMSNHVEKIKVSEEHSAEKSDSTAKASMMKKKKAIISQGKSFCHDDPSDVIGSDVSQDSIFDDFVFPSPIAITEEEALRETHCHFVKFNYHASNTGSFEDGNDDMRNCGFVNSRSSIRREMEKPPRLQKQLSRDRLPGGNKQNITADGATSNVGLQAHGSESSNECLDSTGVDVHEFLVKALQSNPRDRNILLKLERDMIKFINTKENVFMRFPEMTSYHRMLVHRVAAYFGMDHNIDAKGKSVIINKTEHTRIPEKKFHEYILEADDHSNGREEDGKRSILKRMRNCQSLDHAKVPVNHASSWRDAKQKSYEEREDHYERTRARIFQEGPRNDRYRNKDRIVSQWQNRPWFSTDTDSLPNKGSSTPPVSSLATSALTKKANSYPGVTILSRTSNFKKESISSSSSSSSLYQPQQNDSFHNDVIVGEDKHQIHMQPGLYPPPASKSFAESRCTESQPRKSSDSRVNGHVVDFSEKQLVIAVPAGFHVEPGTVLTNPHTGMPYMNLEGQPILHPQGPLSMPLYTNIPLHYPSANIIPQEAGALPQSQEVNGVIQNGMFQPDAPLLNNPPPVNVYHPPSHLIYPYQAAPVHLYSYPVQPLQQAKPPAYAELNGHRPTVENLQTDMTNLNMNSVDQNPAQSNPHIHSNGLGISDKEHAEVAEPVEKQVADAKALPNPAETNEDKEAPQSNESMLEAPHQSPTTNGSVTESRAGSANNNTSEKSVEEEMVQTSQVDSAQISGLGSTTVSTRVGGVTYYTSSDAPPPIQTGSSGQALFPAQSAAMHPHASIYPGGMLPYPYPGVIADGKMYRPIMNHQPAAVDAQRDYFLHASGPAQPPANFMPNTAPPFYYMINGQAMSQYQAAPLFYSTVPNGYPQHGQPPVGPPTVYEIASQDVPPPQPVDGKPLINGFIDDDPVMSSPYPMLVNNLTDAENMQLNNLAARHSAKIVQRAEDVCQDSNAAGNDIFLLFPSSSIAFKAQEEAKSEMFQLSDLADVKERVELLEQINAAK